MIQLEKNVELSKLCLTKVGYNFSKKCQVKVAIDTSGSMDGLIRCGDVQEALDAVFSTAFLLDDDQSLPVWSFDNGYSHCKEMKVGDYGTYVKNHLDNRGGGTSYIPVLKDILGSTEAPKKKGFLGGLFSKKESAVVAQDTLPSYLVFITDGEAESYSDLHTFFAPYLKSNTYIQVIGVGYSSFTALNAAANGFPFIGFCRAVDMNSQSIQSLILHQEFVNWRNSFSK